MKKNLLLTFLLIFSLKSFGQAQQSTSFIHNLSIGAGFNGPDVDDAERLTFNILLGLRYNFTEHPVVEANTFRIVSFDKNYLVSANYSNFYLGLEGRFRISNKFKLLAGIYGGYNYYHYYNNEDDKQTTTGVGPIVGLEYKLSPKLYLLSQSTILYGPYRETNDYISVGSFNELSIPKFFSIEIYYKF